MLTLINSTQVQKLWEIRCSAIRKYRNRDFLMQAFIGLPLLPFIPWLVSGFDLSLWTRYATAAVIMFLIESLIFICLFFIRKDMLFTESPKKYSYFLLISYDILSLSWLVWIFFETVVNYFVLEPSVPKLTQIRIQNFEVIFVLTVALIGVIFSPLLLERKIRNHTRAGKSPVNTKKLSVLIGSAAGIGILLSNILDMGLFFMCILGVLVISVLIFSVSLSMVEFIYFVKLHKTLRMS